MIVLISNGVEKSVANKENANALSKSSVADASESVYMRETIQVFTNT